MPVIVVKGIKPQRLRVASAVAEVKKALQAEAAKIKREYARTTATWRRKPKFKQLTALGANAEVLVGTDDKIYNYVDLGTRPHYILPRRVRRLRFRTGYAAKTTPGYIGSYPGGAFGDYRYARRVRHPGTKARGFTARIQEMRHRPFRERIMQAIRKGVGQ